MTCGTPTGPSEGRSYKFVIFPLSWVMAHVGRTTEIAKVLRSRGHEVVFAGADAAHPKSRLHHATAVGFPVVPVKEPAWHWAWERFHERGGATGFYDFCTSHRWAPLDEIVEDIIRVCQEQKPDMIIGDASVGVSTAAHLLGLPAAGLLNAYNSFFFKPWSFCKTFIQNWDRFCFAPYRKRVYRRHGVPYVNAIELLKTIPLLSPDLPAFHHILGDYPNWVPVGPIVSEPPCELSPWFDELDDGTPNVYITMGSTGILEPLLRRCYPALGRASYRFVVTTAGQVSEEGMALAPDNFRFARYAPGSKILRHCAAMVFHGGNGTMYQAIAAGVPMVALPSHLEQQACIRAPLREGLGIQRKARKVTGDQLLAAIDEVISNPNYRACAQRHSASVLESKGAERAADIILGTVQNGVPAGAAFQMTLDALGFPGHHF